MAVRLERGGAAAGVFAVAIALLSAASCAQVIGLEPFGSTGGGSASGGGGATNQGGSTSASGSASASASSASGGGDACTRCLDAPQHWQGPVTIENGDACASGDPPTVVASLPLPGNACASCCVASGSCSLTITSVSNGMIPCAGDNSPATGAAGCTNFTQTFAGAFMEFAPAATDQGHCIPASPCAALAPEQFAVCGLTRRCQGKTCVPEGTTACIYNFTSSTCPSGFPVSRRTGFSEYQPGCICSGVPANPACDPGQVTVYENQGCSQGDTHNTVTTNMCQSVENRTSVDYKPDEGTCAAGLLTGLPKGPVYVCCTD